MSGGTRVSPKHDKLSPKHKHSPVKGTLYELADFHNKDITPSENYKSSSSNGHAQSSEVLSTSDLISAVSYAWGRAREPLSALLSKSSSKCNTEVICEGDILQYNEKNGTFCASTSVSDQSCSDYLTASESSASGDQSSLEYPKRNRNTSSPQHNYGFFWSVLHIQSKDVDVSLVQNSLSAKAFVPKLQSTYTWMSTIDRYKPKNQALNIAIEDSAPSSFDAGDTLAVASGFESTDSTNSCYDSTVGIPCNQKNGQSIDGREHKETDTVISTSKSETDTVISTSKSETDTEIFTSSSESYGENISLRCEADSHDSSLPLCSYDQESSMDEAKLGLCDQIDQQITPVHVDGCESEISLSVDKPQCSLAKHEHAFAGAMAGIFVSLCLHPMDTIKTVIQSGSVDHKPLHYVGRSIISERGLSGLYRGISSNIATSAPISAVYTFTYESVKKSLLPLLPKENHSFAHCTAGGCASIATSFIFTPSERIKQQMQVGSRYRNCWIALKEVLHRGGLPSLYAGWTAVLCRNIPHSVIKFYTYERLKQITFPSIQSNAQTNTVTTLLCGGLAGSTASLFTTPFDVVKTRMQTQIPGSTIHYAGVFNTLTSIRKTEGLKGLYRGLSPRLVMYMIQGALFFASYESFKSLFLLDVPQLNAQTIQPHQKTKDASTTLHSSASVTS